jgi:hypothetical protein
VLNAAFAAALTLSGVFPERVFDWVKPLGREEIFLRELVDVFPSVGADVFKPAEKNELLLFCKNIGPHLLGKLDFHRLRSAPRALWGNGRIFIMESERRWGFGNLGLRPKGHRISLDPRWPRAVIGETETEIGFPLQIGAAQITQSDFSWKQMRPVGLLSYIGGTPSLLSPSLSVVGSLLSERHGEARNDQREKSNEHFDAEPPSLLFRVARLIFVGVGGDRVAVELGVVAAWTALCAGFGLWGAGRWFDNRRHGLTMIGLSLGLFALSLLGWGQ